MKKTIFLASIFSVIFLSLVFAQPAEAVFLKLTLNVTSVTIPQRAAMIGAGPAEEFKICNSSYFEVRPEGGGAVASQQIKNPISGASCLRNLSYATVVFNHTGGSFIPYIKTVGQSFSSCPHACIACDVCHIDAQGHDIRNHSALSVCRVSAGSADSCYGADLCPNPPYWGWNYSCSSTANFMDIEGNIPYPSSLYFDFSPISS